MKQQPTDLLVRSLPGGIRRPAAISALVLILALAACSTAAPATDTPPPAVTAMPEPAPTDTLIPAPTDTAEPMGTADPSVTVMDQPLTEGSVTVAEAVSDGPGWLVIHAQQDDRPGPVLGYRPLQDGANEDVIVELDLTGITGVLYAMLHTDAGQAGTYEFPGPDGPVAVGGQVVTPAFDLTVPAGEVQVQMVNFAFAPEVVVVKAGAAVTWANHDGAEHTTTSDTGIWDSGRYGGGETFSRTFDEPGVYPFYCKPHGGPGGEGMAGTVVVIP